MHLSFQHVSPENQHGRRNNVHIMVVHLTIADLFVSFVVMPLEIAWRISQQWLAGNVMCKLLMFIRAFAFFNRRHQRQASRGRVAFDKIRDRAFCRWEVFCSDVQFGQ